MKGQLITGLSKNKEVRIYVAETTEMVDAMRQTHDLSPMSTVAMGRLITGSVMMGMMSKVDKEKITVQIKGSGEIGLMVAVTDTHGNIKAYTTTPHAATLFNEKGKFDVAKAIGEEGQLLVIKDLGMKEPFIGQLEMVSGEIAEDLAHYFLKSEQQATAVGLGVLLSREEPVKVAGGFIVQLLPDASEETISQLESNLSGLQSVTQLFEDGLTPLQVAHQAMVGLGLDELETHELRYTCDCSQEKMERALISVGKNELNQILTEDGQAELLCHFCQTRYAFDQNSLEKIIKTIDTNS